MLGHSLLKAGTIRLANLSSQQMTNIDHSIVRVSIEYSMTMASELRFTVIDFNNEMTKKNYFVIGRDVIYTTQSVCGFNTIALPQFYVASGNTYVSLFFEIAEVSISQGPGNTPQIEVSCYSKSVQQMKRDRKPGEIKGSGSDYVKRAAKKYGLRCFAEKSSQKVTINKASGDQQAESLWDVLSGMASEAKFLLFEADGVLFFASQKFLLNKWGSNVVSTEKPGKKGKKAQKITERSIPIVNWKDSWSVNQGSIYSSIKTAPAFELIEYPTFNFSANDPLDVTGSFSIARENGSKFRPGMTVELIGFPGDVDDKYLVDSVSFEDNTPDPVQITFRKPEKKPKDIKDLPIGKRVKQGQILDLESGISITQILGSKNSKKNRPNTNADSIVKAIRMKPADIPQNQVLDPRVLPLPDILNQQRFPKYDYIGTQYPSESAIINAGLPSDLYPINPTGLLVKGNIVLTNRPLVYNPNTQEISTILSLSTGIDGYEVLIPSVVNGEIVTESQAINHYISTGEHLGKFASGDVANVNAYANALHSIQESWIGLVKGYKGRNKLLSTGNIDMYSRPTKLVDGKITTLAQLIVENVAEPGFNNGNPYVAIIPRVYVDESGEPQVYDIQTASSAFISAMAESTTAEFIAKMADIESARDYVKLVNHQQVLILASRFVTEDIPETSIYPLPTEEEQRNYPHMSSLIGAGNIDLYSLPAGKINGRKVTFYPYVYFTNNYAVIFSGIRSVGNSVKLLSKKDALAIATQQDLLFATVPKQHLDIYVQLLIEQQQILMEQRFSGDYGALEEL